jgi:molecular chaperone GrpE (heat shock protein)
VDKAVKKGIVKPGQYLILEFDFSRVARPRNINESVESLRSEINDGLEEFKLEYTNDLGQSFASATSDFVQNDPAGNLTDLIDAVDRALRDIEERGEENHPLRDVQGVCLFQTTAYHNANT